MPKSNRSSRKTMKWILGVCAILVLASALFLFNNFNRLITDALMKNFNSTLISEVYELKFKKLNVNFLAGSIRVNDVEFQPREKPLKDYPYINSSLRLSTKKILLENVEIFSLLRRNILKLEKVQIIEPDIQLTIANVIPVFFPFEEVSKDSLPDPKKNKKKIEAFFLKEFDLTNASARVQNSAKGRDLNVKQVNISFRDLLIDKQPGKDILSYSNISLLIGEIGGSLQKDRIKYISLRDYKFVIDSLKMQRTIDALVYTFKDINMGLKDLDVQTADSLSHLTLQSFDFSYKDQSLTINKLAFKPNISDEAMQKRYKYQNTQFSGSVGLLKLTGFKFDSLIYKKKLFVGEINLDSVSAYIFKDKTKPMDMKIFPVYLGQTVKKIALPLKISRLNATNVNLVNTERKIDNTYAKANINRATVNVSNISNIDTLQVLSLQAGAWLENKVHFSLKLDFEYLKPQFSIDGSFEKFNFSDLNSIITGYTPAKINSGTVDAIKFSGIAYEKNATGTMKFLYHDLNMDLELKEKAKWKSSVLAFAANTIVASANPPGDDRPPRIVTYHVERDMNKSFVNITIKSALAGLKETVMMSKENRKNYKEDKKKAKEKSKK